MATKKQREAQILQVDAWRTELQALLERTDWSIREADRVEELASLLEYSEEDKFWNS